MLRWGPLRRTLHSGQRFTLPCLYAALSLTRSPWQPSGQSDSAHFQEVGTEAQGSTGDRVRGCKSSCAAQPRGEPAASGEHAPYSQRVGSRRRPPLSRGGALQGQGVHPGRHGFLADAPRPGPDRVPAQRLCQGCYHPRAAPRLGPNPEGAGPRVMPAFSLTFQTHQKKLRCSSSRRNKVRPSHMAWEPLGRGAGPRGGAGHRPHSSMGKGW